MKNETGKQMKLKYVLAVVIAIPATLLWINGALHLLSIPEDTAVFGGYLMLAALAIAVLFGAIRIGRRFSTMMAIAVLALANTGCYKVVEPGHVGLLIKQTGSDRGVQDYPIQTGRVFYNPVNEDVLVYPTSVQRAVWTRSKSEGHEINEEISFQSKEGLHFDADVNCSYELMRDKVPHFYVRFRNDDIEAFTHGFLRDMVRNAIGKASTEYLAEEINGAKNAEAIDRALQILVGGVEPLGVHIVSLGFVAPPRPPDQVKQAIEGKIAAIQQAERSENEKRQSIAEGEKIKAMAAATAEANRLVNASLTPNLIQWRQMDILQSKWNGQMPQVVGGQGMPLLNLKP